MRHPATTSADAATWARALGVSREAVDVHRAAGVVDLHVESVIWTRLAGYRLDRRHEHTLFGGCLFGRFTHAAVRLDYALDIAGQRGKSGLLKLRADAVAIHIELSLGTGLTSRRNSRAPLQRRGRCLRRRDGRRTSAAGASWFR